MNLHSFSSRGSGVCRSLFLRTFMVMMLFITGSNGIYAGVDLNATLSNPASYGSWDQENNRYSWKQGYDNLMPIFTGLKGKLNTDYVALKFTTSKYIKDQPYRVCFMQDGNTQPIAEIRFYSEGDKNLVFADRDELKDKDLSNVDKILFGGASTSGSITLDPASIVLVGQSKITVSPNDANKGSVYFTVGNDAKQQTSATVPNHTNVKFYAKPNTENVVFTGWGEDGIGRYSNPTQVEVTKDLNFIANFADGIHIKCTVDPSNAAEPDVYQKGHLDWELPSDGYVGPGLATTFGFKNQQERYNFLGWYDETTGKKLTKETTYTVDKINAETNVIAKFSTDIQNNTKRYDFSKFTLTNQGAHVQSAEYNKSEDALKVTTEWAWDNYFPLYKDLNGTNSTGVRLTAKGVKFRIIAKTSDKDKNSFKVNVPESNGYVTNHYKWEDFVNQSTGAKMTETDVAKITQIGLAGDNDDNNATNMVFYVRDFWLDDIADYNKTIPCYGYEGGRKDEANNSFVYTIDGAAGATAVFEGNNDDRDGNHNIILNAGKNLTLSSDVSKFTEVCLVFGKETTYDLTVAGQQYTGTSTAVICPVDASELTIHNNSSSGISLAKIIYSSEKAGINEERTITVDGKERRYWLYVPASVAGKTDVPVVFSLHGRGNNDKPEDTGKPIFTSLANEKGFIVVYPQGRNGTKADYPDDGNWNNGFVGTTGWEATGKENADTKFIKALVDKIQSDYKTKNATNNNISVDPTKFYLCGFSMGGMMTYACAKVLNGTFAAYGSCGGFPLNEFHMNLATENPIPFIHLHGNKDGVLDINLLHTIIENLLFRNGCKLSAKQNNDDGWTTTTENGITRNDFKGVNGVPVTTVTFDGLGHSVHQSAPAYLWDFFSDKTVGKYDSNIEWKWDMPTINANITESSSESYYGWNHEVNGDDRSLTYGGKDNTDGNHNVYNSIQLTAGKHTLYAKMASKKGVSSVTLRNILTGAETVARKVVDNSGTQAATDYNVLYEFEVGEGAEFSLELKRSDTNSACTLLEIHKGSYSPQGVKDESEDGATVHLDDGKLAELTFENVDIDPINSGYGADLTSEDGNMKLYLKSRLGVNNGTIDNVKKYIVEDPVFGHYFQNIPDADIYDRYGASDYMRVVLGEKNSLSGHKDKDGKDIDGIQKTGKVTIGFWVNGDIAVNRGLAYDEPSMFYIAGDTYNGPNEKNPHMFNITCSGGLSGYMNDGAFEYHSGESGFGGLCPADKKDFYNKNFYKDCNWHYITYQKYDNLSRFNMYVDGEPTCLGGYATHNASSLEECIKGLKSIVLGGANANSVEFGYDVAFAYDDIVIYNRVLSKREINEIIKKKNYSPSVWHFDRNLENNIFFNPDLLNKNMWASSDGSYTLNTNFSSAAALTYDGITEIPAFKGLRFVTNGGQKIKIDAKSGALHLSQGVKVVFSNLKEGTYVRMEYKKENNVNWEGLTEGITISKMVKPLNIPSPSDGCTRQAFKVMKAETGEENSITMPSAIDIIRMEAANKNFAQIVFVDKKTKQKVTVVRNPANDDALPDKNLYVNTTERLNPLWDGTSYNFKYTSSSPHVASIDDKGKVTLHGIAGSTVITAELNNDQNLYDCDIYDQYAFEPSNRIFSSYEIVVEPDPKTSCKVEDNKEYEVGQTLYNTEGTVGVTLGGWTYNEGTYYGKSDEYSKKESWEGQKFEKNADRNGYLANSRKTEEDVFHEFFNDKDEDGKYKKETFSTNGIHAAKSEQLTNDYAATGNYSAPADNKSVANVTPWLLPCRGSHIKIEPTDAGLISVYVMQEGCVSHDDQDEPIDVTVKKVYVADEKGEIVKEVVADTKSKVAAQMWKDDGRARAEYRWDNPKFAYNTATMNSFTNNIKEFDDKWSFLDNWPNPGMQQHVFKLGKDEDGHVLITKGIVRYTFNVLPGKTYYIFSNTAKLGLAGFTFEKGKHAIYHKVKPDAKHDEWRATGEIVDVSSIANVELKDGENYSPTDAKNAEVKLDRTFYKNYWNAICLPYSINRRQIEKVFGDGTMVVLMKEIDTSKKKVMFIEHANQDIIAGYPYLIFPTKKDDTEKTDHTAINGITTRATFGEANSPLFSVGTDGNTYSSAKPMQSDALVFKGTFTNTTLNEGSYVVTNKGVLSRIPEDGMKIKPYRSYIYFNRQTAGAKAISLQDMNVNGFENDKDNTTGIENLLFESGILTHSADVYSIDGQLVRSKALNFNGLPKGVYIVNGKKYVKK